MIEGYVTPVTPTPIARVPSSFLPQVPLSVGAGDALQFHVSADVSYNVTYLRLRTGIAAGAEVFDPVPMAPPFARSAQVQPAGAEPWLGPHWDVSFTLQVPSEWRSGIYAAHCVATAGTDDFFIVFIVKPPVPQVSWPLPAVLGVGQQGPRLKRFAVLSSTNTWNAYNGWGGRSRYGKNPETPEFFWLGFDRPNPAARPAPRSAAEDGASPRHLTRSEVWLLTWLEEQGYEYDVFTDLDFHLGLYDFSRYAAILLNTHPEFWSLAMRDRMDSFLAQGGRLVLLGANGLYERVEFNRDLTQMRLWGNGNGDESRRWLWRHSVPGDPERDLHRSERDVLGVAFDKGSYGMPTAPYQTRMPGHRFFKDTGLQYNQPFGTIGLTNTAGTGGNGAACGWEMDCSAARVGGTLPSDVQVLAEATNHPQGAQMTVKENGQGFVFCAGSIIVVGSLVVDPILPIIIRNVLNECLYPPHTYFEPATFGILRWIVEGILGVGPKGPVPVPPHSPLWDMTAGLAISQIATEIRPSDEASRVRKAALELVACVAREEAQR